MAMFDGELHARCSTHLPIASLVWFGIISCGSPGSAERFLIHMSGIIKLDVDSKEHTLFLEFQWSMQVSFSKRRDGRWWG